MKKTKDKITAILNAITFAESGEHETAAHYLEEASSAAGADVAEESSDRTIAEKKVRSLRQRLEDHFAAMAFAEAGDFGSAADVLQASENKRTVLLAVEGDSPDPASFNYAANLCRRLNARMSVLLIAGSLADDNGTERIQATCKRLEQEGIHGTVEAILGSSDNYLVNYTRDHKEIVTVVYDSPKTRKPSSESKAWRRVASELSQRLSIPLVTVLPTAR